MSSIALSHTGTATSALTETDLAKRAARGDRAAFDELFARHSEPGWRLAQAVAPDQDGAVDSFKDGFVRAIKSRRGPRRAASRRDGSTALRDDILSAVYGAASASSYDPSAPPAVGQDAALADAAFRSLPERWRAAVWLGEVEGFTTERTAGVMGVSAAVAAQLHARGAKGLAGRFVQSHREPPADLGPVLRGLAIPAPADLATATLAGWASVGADRAPLFAPASAWLHDNGFRPLLVAVGGLLAFGLIGLGVIPGNTTVTGQLSATTNGPLAGAVPISTCQGLTCGTGTGGATGVPAGFGTASPSLTGAFASNRAFAAGGFGSGGAIGIPHVPSGFGAGGTGSGGSGAGGSGSSGVGAASASGGGSKSSGSPSKSAGSTSQPTSSPTTTPAPPTTQPPKPLNNVTSAVTALSNTVTSAAGGVSNTVTQLPSNPAGAVSNLAGTAGGAVSGVGTTVNALVGATTTTTAPKAAVTTTPTTACTVNLIGICVGL